MIFLFTTYNVIFKKPQQKIKWFRFLFYHLHIGYGQNYDGLIPTTDFGSATVVPKFVSRGHLYKAIVGDTIELPCKVQNLGKFSLLCCAICYIFTNSAPRISTENAENFHSHTYRYCTQNTHSPKKRNDKITKEAKKNRIFTRSLCLVLGFQIIILLFIFFLYFCMYSIIKFYILNSLCVHYIIGSFVLLWRRGTSVLTAGHLKITRDARFKIVGDYNLQIANVRTQDAGDYICQIGDQETRDQVHTVEILGEL